MFALNFNWNKRGTRSSVARKSVVHIYLYFYNNLLFSLFSDLSVISTFSNFISKLFESLNNVDTYWYFIHYNIILTLGFE